MAYKRNSKIQHKFKNKTKLSSEAEALKKQIEKEKRTYKGTVYRSLLEVECAQQLDKAGLKFEYEKHKFTLLEDFHCPNLVMVHKEGKRKGKKYRIFEESSKDCQDIKYTPDFVNMEQFWIIETKGLRTKDYELREKLFKKYMVDNNITFDFYAPCNEKELAVVIQIIIERNKIKTSKAA